jgi:DNA-binding IclR family transcriptional regulator
MEHDPDRRLAAMRTRALADAKPGRSPPNRSLERGIELLRAFRPGSALLGNAELAERTGLSRSTVSRLTQTLVGTGMLELDTKARAYRLATPVLSLAHAMRSGSAVLNAAAPIMRAFAEQNKVNVGLASPDRDEMVYLESIRYNRRVALRSVVAGQRVPIELTSLGRAYLAVAPEARRRALLAVFKQRRRAQWPALAEEIAEAIESVEARGWCAAAWQPEVVAVSAPLAHGCVPLVVNISVSTVDPLPRVSRELAPILLDMASRIERAILADEGS